MGRLKEITYKQYSRVLFGIAMNEAINSLSDLPDFERSCVQYEFAKMQEMSAKDLAYTITYGAVLPSLPTLMKRILSVLEQVEKELKLERLKRADPEISFSDMVHSDLLPKTEVNKTFLQMLDKEGVGTIFWDKVQWIDRVISLKNWRDTLEKEITKLLST